MLYSALYPAAIKEVCISLTPKTRDAIRSYISGAIGYNLVDTYIDSKIHLLKYRNGTLQNPSVTNDLTAVKYGVKATYFERLWNSILWPITSITNVFPSIVLILNPPKKETPTTPKSKTN